MPDRATINIANVYLPEHDKTIPTAIDACSTYMFRFTPTTNPNFHATPDTAKPWQHLRLRRSICWGGGGGLGRAGADWRLNGNAKRKRRQRLRLAGDKAVGHASDYTRLLFDGGHETNMQARLDASCSSRYLCQLNFSDLRCSMFCILSSSLPLSDDDNSTLGAIKGDQDSLYKTSRYSIHPGTHS